MIALRESKWHPSNIDQGVRQGGVLSTGHYKTYRILYSFTRRRTTAFIGVPHVTVADDGALFAQLKIDMQVMVWGCRK